MPLPLFGKSHKSPPEIVKSLKEALETINKGEKDKKMEKAIEEVSRSLQQVKNVIYGQDGQEPNNEQVGQLAQEIYGASVIPLLIKHLNRFDFESKKDVALIFNNLLRRQIGTRSPTVEYLSTRPEILRTLVKGYESPDIAISCGSMIRECIRHEHLAKIILYSDNFYDFFQYVEVSSFDIASDAFTTFKELITKHKTLAAEFLDTNYDKFFEHYQKLLESDNYVSRRQSLKLLGELLLDRHNFNVMTRYISNPENLKLMMIMLREKSRSIQFEAFHVFKVFVANPNRPRPILDILIRNREKLVEFLTNFHKDRTEDEQFNDEKAYLIKQIQEMKA
uniref:Protein Mo25 (inferred by orthology to a D. melanogaster protein) n=2 Tax=Strongyloides TaxID=6247 RepID=A0A0K0FA48_STRVS